MKTFLLLFLFTPFTFFAQNSFNNSEITKKSVFDYVINRKTEKAVELIDQLKHFDTVYKQYFYDFDGEEYDESISLLSLAVYNLNYKIIDHLIAQPEKFQDFDHEMGIALAIALGQEEKALAEKILTVNPNLNPNSNCPFCHFRPTIMLSNNSGYHDLTDKLLKMEAKVNDVDDEGSNLLHMFPYNKTLDSNLFELALKEIDVNTTNLIRNTPLMVAAEAGNNVYFHKLFNMPEVKKNKVNIAKSNLLMRASMGGNEEIVKTCIPTSDINTVDKYNWNALNYAIEYQNFDAIKLLIENGADVNNYLDYEVHYKRHYTSSNSATIIQIIEVITKPKILKYLIANGLKYDDMDLDQKTLPTYAKKRGCSKELIELYKTVPLMFDDED